MIAGPHLANDGVVYSRHAGRGRACRFGALECGHAALEHSHGGIGEPRIQIPRLSTYKTGLALLCAVVDKALGEKERLRCFTELRAQGAGMDKTRFGMQVAGYGH